MELYSKWCGIQKKIIGIYNDKDVEFPKLWDNKEFYKIKNAIISDGQRLNDDRILDVSDENDAEKSEKINEHKRCCCLSVGWKIFREQE